MRLDFVDLENEEQECNRILRLYDFSTAEVDLIRKPIIDLANGNLVVVPVHELPFVIPMDGCALFCRVSGKDYGIRPRGDSKTFDCDVTADTWRGIVWYMEPFLTDSDPNKFQWLHSTFRWTHETSEICFLFSPHPHGYW